jgi:hypothetical protein
VTPGWAGRGRHLAQTVAIVASSHRTKRASSSNGADPVSGNGTRVVTGFDARSSRPAGAVAGDTTGVGRTGAHAIEHVSATNWRARRSVVVDDDEDRARVDIERVYADRATRNPTSSARNRGWLFRRHDARQAFGWSAYPPPRNTRYGPYTDAS